MKIDEKFKIIGKQIYLRSVKDLDATKVYCSWLNDSQVNKYTESRFKEYTVGDILAYIREENDKKDVIFFAIITNDTDKHIGNIKIHHINPIHKFAEISLLIGEKSYWGKGVGQEAISLVAKYGFDNLKLNKLFAKCYANNIGSIKAFKKVGFKEEGLSKKLYKYNDYYVDGVFLGLLNQQYILK